jgi:FtsP/CotA-like multicopper oxidase with cupredoxin domain
MPEDGRDASSDNHSQTTRTSLLPLRKIKVAAHDARIKDHAVGKQRLSHGLPSPAVDRSIRVLTLLTLLLATASVPAPVGVPGIVAPASTLQNPCPAAPSNSKLVDPPNLVSVNGELDLTLTLTGQTVNNAQNLCWVYAVQENGKPKLLTIPPTLNIKQGERLVITLANSLTIPLSGVETPPPIQIERGSVDGSMTMPAGSKMSGAMQTGAAMGGPTPNPYALMCGQPQLAPTPTPDPVTGRVYGYHRAPWNEANLHFHGLNTSPQAPGDDVTNVLLCPRPFAAAQPGVYHYVVDIPLNEPHAHGESMYQVFLGLTGAIVVHTAQPSIPDQLPNRIAITRDLPFSGGILKYPLETALVSAHPSFNDIRAQLALGIPDFHRNPGGDPFQPVPTCKNFANPVQFQTDSVTVNGLALPLNGNTLLNLPQTTIGLGETQYWRFANTNANTTLDVVLLVNGKPTPLMVTSRDGVPLVVKNGVPTYQPVAFNDVFLMPAQRFEFYLTGATAGAKMVLRTRTADTGCVGDTDLARNLFYVTVGKTPVAQHITIPASVQRVPQRFSDLAAQTPAKKRTFILTEYARTDEPEPDFYITETSNPNAYEHPYRMTGPPDIIVKDGTVEEWTILNYTNEIHAFHIHQIHFLPIDGITVAEGLNQMLDTVVVPYGSYHGGKTFTPGGVKLIMDFRGKDIIGTFVYHCHILEHEDNGMMARIQVIP